jgi:hypothetical protein
MVDTKSITTLVMSWFAVITVCWMQRRAMQCVAALICANIEKRCNAHRTSSNAFCIFGVTRYTCIFGSWDAATSFLQAAVTFDLLGVRSKVDTDLKSGEHALQFISYNVFTKLTSSTDIRVWKNWPARTKNREIFWVISTIETMSSRLRIAPNPPPKPSYALRCFYRCRRSSRGGWFSHQNHWNGLMAVHKSVHLCRLVHKWCAWRWIQHSST